MNIHIGTSGYSYDDWRERFYPKGLPKKEWLSYYSTKFDTVELNVTFYRTPNKKTFESWYKKTPVNFHFVIKGSRFITHLQRLKGVGESLKIFFDAVSPLKEKLRVVLWQLPPKFPAYTPLLSEFLKAVKVMAQKYTPATKKDKRSSPFIRQAFEFRDQSWLTDEVYHLLGTHDAALVVADYPFQMATETLDPYASRRPKIAVPLTASWVYLRRHGPGGLFSSQYTDDQLARDATAIRAWKSSGKDVYVFFNNDIRGYAAANAQTLQEMIKTSVISDPYRRSHLDRL